MVIVVDHFGLKTNDLEAGRKAIEAACGFRMELRDSSFIHGGNYYRKVVSDEEKYRLQHNYDKQEDCWEEDGRRDVPFLLYVSTRNVGRADEIRARLLRTIESIQFLYRGISSGEDGQDVHSRTIKIIDGKEVVVDHRIIRETEGRSRIIKVVDGKEIVVYDKELKKR